MHTDSSNGFLRIDIEDKQIRKTMQDLGNLTDQRYKALKNAINATARLAKADLMAKAQAEYTVKKSSLKKAISMTKATVSNPTATITVKGEPLELRSFKTTALKRGVKAKVSTSSMMKLIESQRRNRRGTPARAFLATFASGHTAIVQRQVGEEYRRDKAKRQAKYGPHADVTRLKKLLSISFPKMVGGTKVYGEIAPSIHDNLQEIIRNEIAKVLKK